MNDIFDSVILSFRDLFRPKILAVMIVPFLGSFLIWGLITWALWDQFVGWGFQLYNWPIMQSFTEFLSPYFILTENPLIFVTVAAILLMGIFPAALVTALLITSILLVPVLVSEIQLSDFPHITRKSSNLFAGTGTSLLYSLQYISIWILTLPLWILIPGGALVTPFILVGWFNSRIFAWEVLTEISAPSKNKAFMVRHSKSLLVLGLLTSVLYYIPIVNLVAPVIVSAAFTRFCLKRYSEEHKNS